MCKRRALCCKALARQTWTRPIWQSQTGRHWERQSRSGFQDDRVCQPREGRPLQRRHSRHDPSVLGDPCWARSTLCLGVLIRIDTASPGALPGGPVRPREGPPSPRGREGPRERPAGPGGGLPGHADLKADITWVGNMLLTERGRKQDTSSDKSSKNPG